MMDSKLIITPKTKIAELLEAYPQLEDVLIDIAPTFKKLKNPVLRRTIARVTSIQQAASVGNVPVDVIVNKLRGIVGQQAIDSGEKTMESSKGIPVWFQQDKIASSFDAREVIAEGGHPLTQVLQDLNNWKAGEVYELITPFLPAPLIDKIKAMGFESWTREESTSLFRNYFCKIS